MSRKVNRLLAAVACLLTAGTTACQVSSGAPLEDSTDSLQAQLDSLKPGGTLTLRPGSYSHAGMLVARVPDVVIDGNGAMLTATNDQSSALKITADRVRLTNLNVAAAGEGKRWAGVDQQKIVVSGSGDQLSNVTVSGSAAAGIFLTGARDFTLNNITVSNTRADGIHVTGGSTNGRIENVKARQTGDDAVGVVSYGNETPCQQIEIDNITVDSTRNGRGISVVGGQNVNIHDFSVSNTNSAGIYIATEGSPYFTDSVQAVTVANGAVKGANTDAGTVQGALLVYSGNAGKTVRDVRFSNIAVSSTPASAERNVGVIADGGSVDAITLAGINITGSSLPPLFADAPSGGFSTSAWTVDGNPISPNDQP